MKKMLIVCLLGVLAAALSGCCCPLDMLISETEFTSGDFADVPAYPGSSQSTESDAAIDAMTTVMNLVADEAEWKHYITSDGERDIADWYEDNLPSHGWLAYTGDAVDDADMGSTLLFQKEGDADVLLVLFVLPDEDGDSHIIIGRLAVAE